MELPQLLDCWNEPLGGDCKSMQLICSRPINYAVVANGAAAWSFFFFFKVNGVEVYALQSD